MTIEFDARRRLGAFQYDASFATEDEIVVLFGHSGAGKSLTLQFIAGLLKPASGRIVIDGRVVFDSATGVNLPPQERGVGYVVQDLALFPHLSVAENVAFGARGTRSERSARVQRLLAQLGLTGMDSRMPKTLSGGQQQRVALARALARDASVLLLDEPFSALDESLRESMRRELLRLRSELGLAILFVTHDLREAHLLADRIAVFDQGRVLQLAPREDVFRRPASRRVAELTGVRNVFRGCIEGWRGQAALVRLGDRCVTCTSLADGVAGLPAGAAVDVAVRAERVNLRRHDPVEGTNLLEARIVEDLPYGASHTLRMHAPAANLDFEIEIASRPYEVLDVAHHREWLVELPAPDLHVMPSVAPVDAR